MRREMIVRRGIMCRSAFIRSKGRASEAPCLAVGAPSAHAAPRACEPRPQAAAATGAIFRAHDDDEGQARPRLHPTLPATSFAPGGSHSRATGRRGSSARTRPRSRRALAACSTPAKTIAQRSRPPAVHSVHRSNQHKRGSPPAHGAAAAAAAAAVTEPPLRAAPPRGGFVTVLTVRRALPGTLRASESAPSKQHLAHTRLPLEGPAPRAVQQRADAKTSRGARQVQGGRKQALRSLELRVSQPVADFLSCV